MKGVAIMRRLFISKGVKTAAAICAITLFAMTNAMPANAENTGVSEMGGGTKHRL